MDQNSLSQILISLLTQKAKQESIEYSNQKIQAVVGMQIRHLHSSPELLIIKRAEREGDPWSGQLAYPGGKVELGESALETLIREYQEELGTDLVMQGEAFLLPALQARKAGRLLDFWIRPILFASDKEDFDLNKEEVQTHYWLPLESLWVEENHIEISVYDLNLPAIRVSQNEKLWGLSYMMLEMLLLEIKKANAKHWPFSWKTYSR